MARIGFLSHSDLSIYYFRSPIMRELKKRGHEVFAIAPNGAYVNRIKDEFEYISYEIDKASLNPFKVASNTKSLAKVLQSLNLDLLQTSAHKSNVFGTFAAKKAGIKNIINLVEGLGSFYTHDNLKSIAVRKIIEILYKGAFKISNACIFVNDADPDYFLAKNIIEQNKIKRIKSVGVNTEIFNPNNIEAEVLSDKKVVLMVGRALWDKGIREFYEAADILKDRDDAQFVFVGDGDNANPSCANNEFLQNKNVMWIRWSDKIPQIMNGSFVFVLPSYKEGFPRTVLEAMSMELPCVVSNSTGCVEAIENNINGLICLMRDSADLAKKIQTLLDDENFAKKLGKQGRQIVLEKYDEPKITQKYLEVYKDFINV